MQISEKLFIFSLNFPFAEINFTFINKILEYYFNSAALYIYEPDFGNASTLIFLGILNKKYFFKKKDFHILFSCLNFFFFCFKILYFFITAVQLQIVIMSTVSYNQRYDRNLNDLNLYS